MKKIPLLFGADIAEKATWKIKSHRGWGETVEGHSEWAENFAKKKKAEIKKLVYGHCYEYKPMACTRSHKLISLLWPLLPKYRLRKHLLMTSQERKLNEEIIFCNLRRQS